MTDVIGVTEIGVTEAGLTGKFHIWNLAIGLNEQRSEL